MKAKKNILFLHITSDWYGADKILYNVLKLLSKEHNCYVVLPYKGILNEKIQSLNIPCYTFTYPVFRKKYLKPHGLFLLLFEFLISFPKFVKIVFGKNIDVIYSNTLAISIGAFLAFVFNKKHCWHIHEILQKPIVFRNFMHWCSKHFSMLNICVSQAVANNVGNYSNVKVVYNGIDPIIEKPIFNRKSSDRFQLAVFARFNSGKGQLHAVKAVQECLKSQTGEQSLKLLLVGSYFEKQKWWLDDIVNYIQMNNLGDYVEIKEFTENIADIYRTLDLYLLPSTLPDSFPTVVLESMSAGVPVIGYDNGGVKEMLQDDSDCLVKPGDYIGLAEKIRYYQKFEDERLKKAKSQYQYFTNNFTMKNYEERFMPVINKIF